MELYPEVMPGAQQRVLRKLGAVTSENRFYLAGGTAIAIQRGHRESIDLDWFTGDAIADPLQLAERLVAAELEFGASSTARGTLHGAAEGVKLSFLEYRYPLLRPLIEWPEYGCEMARWKTSRA
jgi:hypothetical protein